MLKYTLFLSNISQIICTDNVHHVFPFLARAVLEKVIFKFQDKTWNLTTEQF